MEVFMIQVLSLVANKHVFNNWSFIDDAPPSSLLDSKGVQTMSKSGRSWNLVPLPTSSTKGGKRGVLKALGLN
jgi:hypothetical protein